jgi:DNA-binding NarL/FixJ family response regulator
MPRKVITLGIADDMLLDQTMIEHHIKALKNTSILFRSGNGKDLLYKLNYFKPDIIILDLYMPFMNGWEVLHELKAIHYNGTIICTSNAFEPNLEGKLIAFGVKGFVPKQSVNLAKAINEVMNGNTYFETIFIESKHSITDQFEVEISGKEISIINKLAEGKDSKTIATELGGLSANSVDTYIKNLLINFKCNTRSQLVSLGHVYGLIYTFEHLKHLPKPKPKPNLTETETETKSDTLPSNLS